MQDPARWVTWDEVVEHQPRVAEKALRAALGDPSIAVEIAQFPPDAAPGQGTHWRVHRFRPNGPYEAQRATPAPTLQQQNEDAFGTPYYRAFSLLDDLGSEMHGEPASEEALTQAYALYQIEAQLAGRRIFTLPEILDADERVIEELERSAPHRAERPDLIQAALAGREMVDIEGLFQTEHRICLICDSGLAYLMEQSDQLETLDSWRANSLHGDDPEYDRYRVTLRRAAISPEAAATHGLTGHGDGSGTLTPHYLIVRNNTLPSITENHWVAIIPDRYVHPALARALFEAHRDENRYLEESPPAATDAGEAG
jgi:hypothetical protein